MLMHDIPQNVYENISANRILICPSAIEMVMQFKMSGACRMHQIFFSKIPQSVEWPTQSAISAQPKQFHQLAYAHALESERLESKQLAVNDENPLLKVGDAKGCRWCIVCNWWTDDWSCDRICRTIWRRFRRVGDDGSYVDAKGRTWIFFHFRYTIFSIYFLRSHNWMCPRSFISRRL